ncbi:MAG: hypothetical protein JWN70_2883 [Planctomycetaceae bacterium]|nr:hypothetical protein [Planctomycetaceae bacterium]
MNPVPSTPTPPPAVVPAAADPQVAPTPPASTESLADVKPDFVLTTQEIRQKVKAADQAGQAVPEELIGKVIEVKGPLNIMELNELGVKYHLHSEGDAGGSGTSVYLKEMKLPWKQALPPQIVTFRGRGNGIIIFDIRGAEIVKVEGKRCAELTADILAKSKADETFEEKYKEKFCIFEGVVAEVKDNREVIAAELKENSKDMHSMDSVVTFEAPGEIKFATILSASYVKGYGDALMAIKKGDKIKIGGTVYEDKLVAPNQITLKYATLLIE